MKCEYVNSKQLLPH